MRYRRAQYRCALPGFPEHLWGPAAKGYYMGAFPILGGPETSDEPPESTEDGCPGAWYRCEFVRSLVPYERHCGGGVYSENLLLTRSADPLVLEAIHYMENERARSRIHKDEMTL